MKNAEEKVPAETPSEKSPEEYGPEYVQTMKIRTELEKLKKAIANINPPLDAILKY